LIGIFWKIGYEEDDWANGLQCYYW